MSLEDSGREMSGQYFRRMKTYNLQEGRSEILALREVHDLLLDIILGVFQLDPRMALALLEHDTSGKSKLTTQALARQPRRTDQMCRGWVWTFGNVKNKQFEWYERELGTEDAGGLRERSHVATQVAGLKRSR